MSINSPEGDSILKHLTQIPLGEAITPVPTTYSRRKIFRIFTGLTATGISLAVSATHGGKFLRDWAQVKEIDDKIEDALPLPKSNAVTIDSIERYKAVEKFRTQFGNDLGRRELLRSGEINGSVALATALLAGFFTLATIGQHRDSQ